MNEKPKPESETITGVLDGYRWTATLNRFSGKQYVVDDVFVSLPDGVRLGPRSIYQGSFDSREEAMAGVHKLVRELTTKPN